MDSNGGSSSSSGGYRLVLELKSLRPFSNFGGFTSFYHAAPAPSEKNRDITKIHPGQLCLG